MPPIKQVVACDVNQSTENELSWEWYYYTVAELGQCTDTR